MNKVLVTGGSGFLGRHLIAHMLSHGVEVTAALRRPLRSANIPTCVSQTGFDLADPGSLDCGVLAGIDCVYHLAAHVHVMRQRTGDDEQFDKLNVTATEVLASAAARAGVRRFVYLSSIKVNGERTLGTPFRADDEPAPKGPYARSKWRAENALTRISKGTGLEVVIVRPPLIYGPEVKANFMQLLSLAYGGWPLPFGSIDNRRSLVSVWNLTDWLWLAGFQPRAAGRTWLVSDGEDVSTPGLVRLIAAGMRQPVRIWNSPVALLRAAGKVTGRRAQLARLLDSLQVDISETRSAMGWKPAVPLEEGIARTAAWYVGHRRATC